MESPILTIILIAFLVMMMFSCGKTMKKSTGGCCSVTKEKPKESSSKFHHLEAQLKNLEQENKQLKKEIHNIRN